VFHLPEEGGSAQAVTDEIPVELQADAQTAADSCPTGAIEIR
jgi:ferredoxin